MLELVGSRGMRRSNRHVGPGASLRFVVATEQLDSGTPVLSVTGDVDVATAPALERTLLEAAEIQSGEVIVDLTACSFLDSRGLAALLAARARLARSNRALALILSNPGVVKIFEITGFDQIFAIYPSVGMALNGNGNGNGLRSAKLI